MSDRPFDLLSLGELLLRLSPAGVERLVRGAFISEARWAEQTVETSQSAQPF